MDDGLMTYRIEISDAANKDIDSFKRAGDLISLKRLNQILEDLRHHPETGIGSRATEIPAIWLLVKANKPKRPTGLQNLQRNHLRNCGFGQRALFRQINLFYFLL